VAVATPAQQRPQDRVYKTAGQKRKGPFAKGFRVGGGWQLPLLPPLGDHERGVAMSSYNDGPTVTAPARSHALYRFYGEGEVLLYVGITADLGARLKQHGKDKPWWTAVRMCTVEHYDSREDVLEAERHAIVAECPRHNIQHARHSYTAPLPRPTVRSKTEADRTTGSHWLGTVGAFGMADGTCPVGLVTCHDRTGLTLALYSWLTGYFGAGTRHVAMGDLRQFCVAYEMSDTDMAVCGIQPDGEVVWDMDPLAEFQTAWKVRS
jgi:hypothetical protein